MVTLGDQLQSDFGITISPSDMVLCRTVGDFHTLISGLLAGEGQQVPVPNLLLEGPTEHNDRLVEEVLTAPYLGLDPETPAARLRGTQVVPLPDGTLDVVGWQRNVSRIQRMDCSLPTIIRATVSPAGTLAAVSLDASFTGSRGVLCFRDYLDRHLQACLTGRPFDGDLLKHLSVDHLHCFHVSEVMRSMVSAVAIQRLRGGRFHEQECMDMVMDDETLLLGGIQRMDGVGTVTYGSIVEGGRDLDFRADGSIYTRRPLAASAYVDGAQVSQQQLDGRTAGRTFVALNRLWAPVRARLAAQLGEPGVDFQCSNLERTAFAGLFVQSVAVKFFGDNYPFVLHALSGLQRAGGRPVCVGGVADQGEADAWFAGYRIVDAIQGTDAGALEEVSA